MARILLGVTGGVAAYKAVDVVRLATAAGHAVRVVQTETSVNFVGRATFEAVTGAPVLTQEFEPDPARGAFPGDDQNDHAPISHLELVRRCDVFAIAPVSANTLAKLAGGHADNLLTSAALASDAPLVLAPAMNHAMWSHPATQGNLATLISRGARVVQPEHGRLASKGEWGMGRLADPARIYGEIEAALDASGGERFTPRSLDGLRVLITAGGTREPIDAVRYVGNRSSGRMGVALAAEAAARGAEVVLVGAHLAVTPPDGVRHIEVGTAAELEAATVEEFASSDVLLMAAAVADFRPSSPEESKIKKAGRQEITLTLEATTDVLAAIAKRRRPDQTLVGFAAEHGGDGVGQARAKLEAKGLDAVVLNDVSQPGIGFDSADNEVVVVEADGERVVPRGPKQEIAAAVLDRVEALRAARQEATP